jgi:hypothetical protein
MITRINKKQVNVIKKEANMKNSIAKLEPHELKAVSGGEAILAIGTILTMLGFYLYKVYELNKIKQKSN